MNKELIHIESSQADAETRTGSSAETARQTAANQSRLDKFCASQGHGFAAEDANTMYDCMLGRDAQIIGDDNAKNGADRLVDGTFVQTKYCQSASDSVSAAFRDGQYRYVTSEGAVMDLEVPADQYEQSVELMADRIRNGEVPGVSDPAKAQEIVRKGHFTYAQAKNIAKFGTIESLTFDSVQGVVVCSAACGITAALTFVQSMWAGLDPERALEHAAHAGLQVGGAAFVASVVGSQLMRTGARGALTKMTDAITRMIGPKLSAGLLRLLKPGSTLAGAAAMKSLSKLLRGNIVTGALTTVCLAVPDIANACRGRISGKQLFKNLVKTIGGVAGGIGGYMAGSLVCLIPGAGPVIGIIASAGGAVAGSVSGEAATKGIMDRFVEDDAIEMVRIIESVFTQQSQDYMLTEEETEILLDDLAVAVSGETLLEMYASTDREAFASDICSRVIAKLIQNRCGYFVFRPESSDWLNALNAVADGTYVARQNSLAQVDAVEVGRRLLGRELATGPARKGLYAAKQMNMRLAQSEFRLNQMVRDEHEFEVEMQEISSRRESIVSEINEVTGGLFDDH